MTLSVGASADPPALRRLAVLDERWAGGDTQSRRQDMLRPRPGGIRSMGYQPALDGLRAISVIAVVLFHAGFSWMHGGFFGVEVFFVVSGYLITSLLLDEREKQQRISLEQFWMRRARRLLPALATMLAAVAVWAAFFGSAEQQSTLKRDLPWSLFYAGNWGQILGTTPYFSSADPPLLRHLWSLAVEEQWYLIWPLVFVGVMTIGAGRLRSRGSAFVGIAVAIMFGTSVMHGHVSDNALYLSTITRSSGLLLGAGCAFVWRPWRSSIPSEHRGRRLDPIGAGALTLLICIMSVASLQAGYVYQWLLPVVSILAMVVIAVAVYPGARGMRAILGWRPLVEVGRRSYGIYLWHWPVFVIGHVYHSGSWTKFVVGVAVTAAISEACYRFVETPVRKGALGAWMREQRQAIGQDRVRRARISTAVIGGAAVLVVGLFAFYVGVQHFDAAAGGAGAVFSLDPTAVQATAVALPAGAAVPATPTTAAALPRRLVVVGDSQAHALAINLPDGIGSTFRISDGSVEGCGVYDTGTVVSKRSSFNRSFTNCNGWSAKWAAAAATAKAQVALVVIGAWEVFDVKLSDRVLKFGTADADAYFVAHLQEGISALKTAGSQVALLEVACMRPVDVKGAGVPALPERGDDKRTAHVNQLLRQVAAADPTNVSFVAGPTQWCADQTISRDLGYRWDGVHVYKPGANLIYETIAPALLQIPVPQS